MMGVFDDPIDVQQIQNPINWQLERKNTTRMIIWIYVQSHIRVYLFLIINIRKLVFWRYSRQRFVSIINRAITK